MNIEKIFNSVDKDDMNSPLISICTELEKQGYQIKIEDVKETCEDLDHPSFIDLEKSTNEFVFELYMENNNDQNYLRFI
jgi:hypothetical protein